MKKITLYILLSLFCKTSFSQGRVELGLQFEPQRTWNLSSDYRERYTYQKTSGESYGVSFIYKAKTKFILESGILFSNQGQKFTESRMYYYNTSFDSTILNIHFDLRYIKIPVLPGVSGNRSSKVFFNINLGLQFSILNSATLIVEDTKQSPFNYNETTEFKDTYKGLTVDLAFRLGLNVHLTKQMLLSALLAVDQSLTDVDKNSVGYGSTSSVNRTLGGIIRISYVF